MQNKCKLNAYNVSSSEECQTRQNALCDPTIIL